MPQLKVRGGQIAYQVIGEGVPLVLVPPPVVGSAIFYHQVTDLSRDFMVILPELRGHAASGPLEDGVPLTYDVVADDLLELVDGLKLKKTLMAGYSMGASAVFEFAQRNPHRLFGAISISGLTEAATNRLQVELSAAASAAKAGILHTIALAFALGNAESTETFRRLYRAGKQSDLRAVRDLFDCARHYHCTDAITRSAVPTWFIFGERDGRLKRQMAVTAVRFATDRILYIPKAGHQLPTKRASEVNHLIRTIGQSQRAEPQFVLS